MPEEKYKIAKAEFKKKMLAELFKTKKALVNYENDIFNYTFDRAYILGREKETISQEEIRKAAVEYAEENMWYPGETSYEGDINDMTESFADAFESGANFALGKHDKDAEDTVISGWVARDDGERWHERELHLFTRNKPERRKLMGDWTGRPSMTLDSNLFPDLTWSGDPIEVEIIIKRKKKTENQ